MKRNVGIKPSQTLPTVGVDYCSKNVQVDATHKVKLQIWDTAGQEHFRSITKGYGSMDVGTTRMPWEHWWSMISPAGPPLRPWAAGSTIYEREPTRALPSVSSPTKSTCPPEPSPDAMANFSHNLTRRSICKLPSMT